MTKKQSKPSIFEAMEEICGVLKHFDQPTRQRIFAAVDANIEADKPKPRKQRSDAGKVKGINVTPGQPPAPSRAQYEAMRKAEEPDTAVIGLTFGKVI